MQAHSNSLQFFSLSEIAKHPTDPAAALGGAKVCTTPMFCTKKGHKARRREGDKCFFTSFFHVADSFRLAIATSAQVQPFAQLHPSEISR